MSIEQLIFLGMVFMAVTLLATSVIVPTLGYEARALRRLRARVRHVSMNLQGADLNLLRQNYLKGLSPAERLLENVPGMQALRARLEQAGHRLPAYRFVLICIFVSLTAAILTGVVTRSTPMAFLALLAAALLPLLVLNVQREKRLVKFESQLSDALNSISRALRAGHPFNSALKLASEEMDQPLAGEFEQVFNDLNYGMDSRIVFAGLLQRVPSFSLMTMVTAVQVQKDTGGNLAEILDKIAEVVRSRFRFQRKVRTLSAEGRLSAWILTLVPFILAAIIAATTPDYLPRLTRDPTGHTLILIAFVNLAIGIMWIRHIIRIRV